ncbi:hypothetical protein NDU88_004964, partial [Pleurodeles waltl]
KNPSKTHPGTVDSQRGNIKGPRCPSNQTEDPREGCSARHVAPLTDLLRHLLPGEIEFKTTAAET